jgi:hypothetical protein
VTRLRPTRLLWLHLFIGSGEHLCNTKTAKGRPPKIAMASVRHPPLLLLPGCVHTEAGLKSLCGNSFRRPSAAEAALMLR